MVLAITAAFFSGSIITGTEAFGVVAECAKVPPIGSTLPRTVYLEIWAGICDLQAQTNGLQAQIFGLQSQINNIPAGPQGTQGEIGPQGPMGDPVNYYTVKKSYPFEVNFPAVLECDGLDIATSGGWTFNTDSFILRDSCPTIPSGAPVCEFETSPTHAWLINTRFEGSTQFVAGDVFVMCADVAEPFR